MAEVAKALLDPAAVHHMHAAELQVHVPPGILQHLENVPCHIGRNIDLPTEFTDIGHPMRAGQPHADLNLLRGAKRVHRVADIIGRDLLQQLARAWPHDRQDALPRGYIGNGHAVIPDQPPHAGLIRQPGQGRRHNQVYSF